MENTFLFPLPFSICYNGLIPPLCGRIGEHCAMTRILIVEDDPTINNLICEYLSEKDFDCRQAFSGTEGRLLFNMEKFDLILLDLMIPGLTGEELISHIRSSSQVPVIVLSAKTALEDKVRLLSTGADDYLTKPFELEELLARIQVQLRHKAAGSSPASPSLQYKDWELDEQARAFLVKGQRLDLTAHELGIITLLMKYPKKVFTKQEIFESVWHQDYFVEDKTINVHISNIRSKLKETGTDSYIQTVWGIGFKLKE